MTSKRSEGELFKSQLGDSWHTLCDGIQKRFDADPTPKKPLAYKGTMTKVWCSAYGKLLAYLSYFTGALLPYCGENIPVDILVFTKDDLPDIFKRRNYFFPSKKPFLFKSNMRLGKQNQVMEYVGFGLGMIIQIEAREGNLHFYSNHYFLQLGTKVITLPSFLTPGETYLVHENLSDESFRIEITINHKLFGPMYYQQGVFHHCALDELDITTINGWKNE